MAMAIEALVSAASLSFNFDFGLDWGYAFNVLSEFAEDPSGVIEDIAAIIIERLSPISDLEIDMTYFDEGQSALLTVNAVFSFLKPAAIYLLRFWIFYSWLVGSSDTVQLVQFGECVPSKESIDREIRKASIMEKLRKLHNSHKTKPSAASKKTLEEFLVGEGTLVKDTPEWNEAYNLVGLQRTETAASAGGATEVDEGQSIMESLMSALRSTRAMLRKQPALLWLLVASTVGGAGWMVLHIDHHLEEQPRPQWLDECGLEPHLTCLFFDARCLEREGGEALQHTKEYVARPSLAHKLAPSNIAHSPSPVSIRVGT